MADRDGAIEAFLKAHGWGGAKRLRLAGDASFRHYERVTQGGRTAVLMDAPPAKENVRSYVTVARILKRLGYSAPEIYAEDVANGLLLIEDLGDDTYTRIFAHADDATEHDLYALAVDLLIDLHRRDEAAITAGVPGYDDEKLLAEAALLVDWYLPAMRGEPAADSLRREYLGLWTKLFPVARAVKSTLVLRDYHVDNLMWLPRRRGLARVGLLDFQDAVKGPAAYDLVSLLEDARRDIKPSLVREMMDRYAAAFPAIDRAAFLAAYSVLGAQRHCKVIGIFTRLAVRDRKPVYLGHIPRVWRLVEADLAHPVLRPVADWLARHIPPELRGVPKCQSAA
ncbi:MAG TPA: phosphotransferase [Alphaproteobacteria bacterium]|jgi:aminoglycoside/choline kinase family phosphotransferase|nr:phosphotransferase [Alphaproteobacteria bacterium]